MEYLPHLQSWPPIRRWIRCFPQWSKKALVLPKRSSFAPSIRSLSLMSESPFAEREAPYWSIFSILTISKLDSNLLLITPVPVQPIEIVRQVQQMFMVECQKVHDIQTAFHIADSYQALNVDIVMLDSSRLLQVVSNQGTLGSFGVSFELCTLLLAFLLLTLFIFSAH